MNGSKEQAVEYFNNGFNCAQAVLLTFAEELGVDEKFALSVSCGFGGGMGRLQQTCGAVTGAFMVISIFNCKKYQDNSPRKEMTYEMIQSFNEKFIAKHGSTNCFSLIQCDLMTSEGRIKANEAGVFRNVCDHLISDTIEILEDLMK
jgi:C_GCAxxG_C_C family probable redox protein